MDVQPVRRSYDHRVKALVAETGNPYLFKELDIPHSNTYRWAREGISDVVTSELFDDGRNELIIKLKESEAARERAEALNGLLVNLADIFNLTIEWKRLPDGEDKQKVLDEISRANKKAELRECLKAVKMSPARYGSWKKRAVKCDLDDHSSCPKLSPYKITAEEKTVMKSMVTSKDFAHFPIAALAIYSMKIGLLFCSSSSWYRLIKKHSWLRPRKRLYPERPKIGLKASRINQYWHVDATILRLGDGTKAFLQVVSDNFSKLVLAWRVSREINGRNTKELLLSALKRAIDLCGSIEKPTVIADSGSENVNAEVYSLVKAGVFMIQIAQIDIQESNSAAEVIFRMAKHNYLFFQSLDTMSGFERHCQFYFGDYCDVIPHSALEGATPMEAYTAKWGEQEKAGLSESAKRAIAKRKERNLSQSCRKCPF